MNVSFFRMTFLRVIIQAAAAGGVPAKLIDTLMHECIQVKTSPDGLPPEDSSDAEGEEEEIVAAVESSEKTLGAAVALLSAHGVCVRARVRVCIETSISWECECRERVCKGCLPGMWG